MKIIIFERKRKNDDLSELFGNIRQDATDVFFYSVTDCRWLPLAIFGTNLNLYYPSISVSDMVFNTAEVVYYDVLDELIEVAGDYIPPEYLFGLSVAYDYQSKHNEAVAELSEKASLFFMGATLPTLALTGKAMGSAAPSLATPAGSVVEGGTAVAVRSLLWVSCCLQRFVELVQAETGQRLREIKTFPRSSRIRPTKNGLKIVGLVRVEILRMN